jgi:hypothetical protein
MKTVKSRKSSAPLLITGGSSGEPAQDEIALRAYSIWEEEGHPQNHDFENWLHAEAQLRQTRNQHGVRA